MNENIFKGLFTAAMAAVGAYFRTLLIPSVLLVLVMGIDYFTGVAKARITEGVSSRIGVLGFVKKLCYIAGVGVAVVVDLVIQIAVAQTGIDLGGCFMFGLLVTIWLILNECISILENIMMLGVPIPAFLVKFIKKLKLQAEAMGEEYVSSDAEDTEEDTDDE